MKKYVFTLLTAAALGVAALAPVAATAATAHAATSVVDQNQGTVTITAAAGAQVYADPAFTQPIKGKVLPKNSTWRVFDKLSGTVGYGLGGKQYIKSTAAQIYSISALEKGIFTVNVHNHPTWGTVLYNKDFKPIKVLPAQSKWRYFTALQVFGQDGRYNDQYYDLGGQQYVKVVSYPTEDQSVYQINGDGILLR